VTRWLEGRATEGLDGQHEPAQGAEVALGIRVERGDFKKPCDDFLDQVRTGWLARRRHSGVNAVQVLTVRLGTRVTRWNPMPGGRYLEEGSAAGTQNNRESGERILVKFLAELGI
jgi:hypothetical protein